LEIAVRHQGTTTTIALRGEWDVAEQHAARQAIQSALAGCPECLVLDLSQLTFIDSTGIHVAIELAKRSIQQNVRLVIVPGPPAVQRPFEILRLSDALPFLPSARRLPRPPVRSGGADHVHVP
jgi:anti-anti-sigma factor